MPSTKKLLSITNLKKYFPDMESYLEIGCGTGFVLKAVHEAFPHCRVSGSELFAEGLDYARERMENYIAEAVSALDAFPAPEYRDALREIADFVGKRQR